MPVLVARQSTPDGFVQTGGSNLVATRLVVDMRPRAHDLQGTERNKNKNWHPIVCPCTGYPEQTSFLCGVPSIWGRDVRKHLDYLRLRLMQHMHLMYHFAHLRTAVALNNRRGVVVAATETERMVVLLEPEATRKAVPKAKLQPVKLGDEACHWLISSGCE